MLYLNFLEAFIFYFIAGLNKKYLRYHVMCKRFDGSLSFARLFGTDKGYRRLKVLKSDACEAEEKKL